MEQNKLNRLNSLFEKMVANSANLIEKRELKSLYNEFINDGRDQPHQKSAYNHANKVAINS
ncbi:hypothetical protein Q4493_03850 [Colwellia sp. 1_MG-2023]|nr:hypothetical protein [Colwellia sp. 1_MG-2023]